VAYFICSGIFVNGCDHRTTKISYSIDEKSVDSSMSGRERASDAGFDIVACVEKLRRKQTVKPALS